ncbi:hypothetical protein [Bartonella sp. HY406]|uniref:hypothetical protein n=1 Tax=Bartonella sp. HY406 TaxID=2979331 RepID=UPI0021CA8AD4|nr:hypothetical protein [Bartonella sp. HY406]UXN05107.1 hypothetical protein N6B01_15050 [Bartonella sp. HY406]
MVKSPVSGVAGSVRIQRLSAVAFAAAEAHGKRLDHNGKMRAINDLPPLTTTGLHLSELYQAHAKDTMRSKSKTKALHAIIQFPAQLINHNDKQNMLNYARKFMTLKA